MFANKKKLLQPEVDVVSNTFKMIAWDLGDTLVRHKPGILRKIVEMIYKESEIMVSVDQLDYKVHLEWLSRTGTKEERKIKSVKDKKGERRYWIRFYRSVLSRLGVDKPSNELLARLADLQSNPDSFECMPGAHKTLKSLKRSGVKLILISNAFPSAQKILKQRHLDQYFDHVVLSYAQKVSVIKPEPEIYNRALHLARVPAEESLFVDDRIKFLEGAEKVGMTAIWLNHGDNQHSEWEGKQVRSIEDVVKLAGFPLYPQLQFFQGLGRFLQEIFPVLTVR